jgi:hypothetical protein
MRDWFNVGSYLLVGAFCALALWSAHDVFVIGDPALYAEDGFLESVQAGLLASGALVFLAPFALRKEQGKLVYGFCSLLCYSFVVRELDVERLNVPEVVKFIGSGIGRNVSLALAFSAILIYALANFSYYKKAGLQFLKSRPGILLMLGGVLLQIGDMFEKNYGLQYHVFYEEFSELTGYALILLSALAVNSAISRRNASSPTGGR